MVVSNKRFRQQIIEVARAGETTTPRCLHAPPLGQCGGCVFQDRAYPAQVAAKRAALRNLWSDDLPDDLSDGLDVIASPNPFAYRTRMDFVASKGRFGLRRGGRFNYIIDLQECHLVPMHAFAAARAVYEHAMALGLPDYNLKTHAGFLRYVVVRRNPDDELLLGLVTAVPEEEEVSADKVERIALAALEHPGVLGIHWLINATRADVSFGEPVRHWGRATLPMRVGAHTLDIGPNTFFQNNVWLLMPLLDAVRDAVAADGRAGAVADLYGGVGTIALHIADLAERIVCIESVGESVRLARENSARAGYDHIIVVEADVAHALRAQTSGAFDVVVADPPRTGLGPDVCRELLRLRPQRIVYVSCNPLTQRDDIHALQSGYRLVLLQGYDMFPHTPHLESLAVLDRRG
jgi:23S rRNA (uracil-5-)-methyltransferase RumA